MSDTTTTPMQLTAEDCAAIRGATTYVVRLEGDTVRLDLTRKERTPDRKDGYGRTTVERERTIGGAAGTTVRGTFVELYPGGAWQALSLIVRPGDVLRFYAHDDNSNGYLRAAVIPPGAMNEQYHYQGYPRIYLDECCVDVVRGTRLVLNRLVLCHQVSPQNSARAVQPTPRRERQEVA